MVDSILNSFPQNLTPRPVQEKCLKEIEAAWNTHDVFVVSLPTGSGKSYVAATIAKWQKGAAIATPTNLLVEQYVKDFPRMPKLVGKARYECFDEAFSNCKSRSEYHKRIGMKRPHCPHCPYLKDQRSFRAKWHRYWPHTYVTNTQLYQTMKNWKPVLIADEAHNLIPFLQEKHATKVWRHDWNYPDAYWSRSQLLSKLKQLKGIDEVVNALKTPRGAKGIKTLWDELHTRNPSYLITKGEDSYFGEIRECLKLCPIDIRDMPPLLWPSAVRKVVLLSATIGPKDIELLGLNRRRVKYVEAESPIPAAQRPVVVDPVANLNRANMQENLPKVAKYVRAKLAQHPNEKGVIHVTYAMARELRSFLSNEERLLWHDKLDVKEKYNQFRASKRPLVLVASGLYEGIDLPDEAGRWQIIGKIPWPSLGEPAIRYRLKEDPEWYSWETTKLVLQACGRICRGPEDYGITYIIDGTFQRLYSSNEGKHFPDWLKEAIHGI